MSINRLSRDNILKKALDLADSPTLNEKNRSDGSLIDATAMVIEWLQEGIDYFYTLYPLAGLTTFANFTIAAATTVYALPTDTLKVYRDGLVLPSDSIRVAKKSLSFILGLSLTRVGPPQYYVEAYPNIQLWPIPDKAYSASIAYYKMPPALINTEVPAFPSDYVLVEYVHLKCKEWLEAIPKGSAMEFAKAQVSELRKAGIMDQLEEDVIPFDRSAFPGGGSRAGSTYDWMGDIGNK